MTGYKATTANVLTLVDATVTKTVSAPAATIGDPEAYTVLVTIPAGINLYDALVRDTLHDGIAYDGLVSASCTSGCGGTPIPISEIPHSSNSDGTTTLGFWLGEVPSATTARVLTIVYDAHVLNTYHTAVKVLAGQTLNNAAEVDDNQSQTLTTNAPATIPATSAYTYRSPAAGAVITVVEPSITLAKAVSDPSTTAPYAQPGDQLTYALTVTNAGTSTAYDVPVTDTPNAHIVGLVAQTGASYVTQAWTAGTPTMGWYIPSIPSGQTVTLTYTATLAASASLHNGEVDANASSVTGYYGESDAVRTGSGAFPYRTYASVGPKSASVTVALPQLSVSNTTGASGFPKTANAEVDQPFGWRATVSNTSPAATADTAGLTYQLPANWTYIAGSAGSFGDPTITTSAGVQLLTWANIGSIAPGATVIVPFTAQPTVAAEQNPGSGPSNLNTSSESATAADQGGASGSADGAYAAGPNTANADLLVPALSVTKTPKNGTFTAGSPGAWSIKVANGGTGTARNVAVSDNIPAGDAFSSGAATASPSTGFSQTAYDSPEPTTNVTWTIASIAAGANATITVPTTVASNLANGATLANTAQAQSTEEPTPVSDTGNVTIAASADVAVTNSAAPSPATAGGDLEYTIKVTDNGPSDAQGVTLSDPLPASAVFVAFDSNASSCSQSAGSVSCSFGTLSAGASQQVKVHVKLASNAPASVSDTATVASTTSDPNSANNTATATVAVGRTADRSLTDSASPASVVQGQDVSFTLTAVNGGPSDAPSTVITDVLPGGLSFVSASAGCTNSSGTVSCAVGTLADGAEAVYTVVVKATQVGVFDDAASVSSGAVDPATSNNSASDGVNVGPAVDLAIGVTGPATVAAGGDATYTLTVTNNGPSDATGVVVADTLPAGLSFVSAAADHGNCSGSGQVITCPLGALANGSSMTITVIATASVSSGGQTLVNPASVSGNESDPNLANSSSSASSTIGPAAEMSITDTADHANPAQQQNITYTLTYANHGPSTAHDATIVDTLPAGTTFKSSDDANCVAAGGVVTCDEGTMDASTSGTMQLVVSADQLGVLHDAANVSADEPDPDTSNNSASADVTNGPTADLTLTKTTSTSNVAADGVINYGLAVQNAGPSAAHNVVITDQLPAGESFVDASVPGGTCVASSDTVTCTIAEVDAGDSVAATLHARAGFALAGTTVVNTATVAADEFDINPSASQTSSVPVDVGPAADLSVVKTAPAASPAGRRLVHSLDVRNAGPDQPTAVTVADVLPAGQSPASAQSTQGACSVSGQAVTCQLGAMPSGGGAQVLITTAVSLKDENQKMTNTASVSANDPDPDPGNNQSSASTLIGSPKVAGGHLVVSKTADTSDPDLDRPVDYTITVRNASQARATGVVTVDQPSAAATLVSITPERGSCTGLRCQLGTIAPHQQVLIHVVMKPLVPGQMTNTVTVTSDQGSAHPKSNTAFARTVVRAPFTRLSLDSRAGLTEVHAGRTVRYTLTVGNTGTHAAAHVTVCDRLAPDMTFADTNGVRLRHGQACWTVALLAAGRTRVFHLRVRLVGSASGRSGDGASATAANAKTRVASATVMVIAPSSAPGEGVTG